MKRPLIIIAVIIFTAGAITFIIYNSGGEEVFTLNEETRQNAPGQFVDIPAGKVHYELTGPEDSTTVVLVHGFSVPYYIWDTAFEYLANNNFRVLRYDLFGRGFSDRPHKDNDKKLFDEQLLDLLKALNIDRPIDLAGLSMGGAIAAHFTAEHPEKVRRLIIVDPSFPRGSVPFNSIDLPIIGEFKLRFQIAPFMAQGQMSDFFEPERFPGWVDKYKVQMQYMGFERSILSTVRNFMQQDFTPDYAAIGRQQRDIMLFWGAEDVTISEATINLIRKIIPGVIYHKIERAGHLPHYERPEIVMPIIEVFLRK